jgi:DnaJ-class molecular chaperone
MRCPRCKGLGQMPVRGYGGVPDYEPCKRCNGTGIVPDPPRTAARIVEALLPDGPHTTAKALEICRALGVDPNKPVEKP